ELGSSVYTFLIAEDRGGGSVILPGPEFSLLAPQDFASRVAVGRVRRDFGVSFMSFLLTDREIEEGGHNRVLGPDFQWRPTARASGIASSASSSATRRCGRAAGSSTPITP